jgi:pre-mRNA-splicing helicase BRR2
MTIGSFVGKLTNMN